MKSYFGLNCKFLLEESESVKFNYVINVYVVYCFDYGFWCGSNVDING